MKTTFITWYPTCRRSDTIAEELGGSSHLIHFLKFKQPLYAPFKYVMQATSTWRTLRKERPDVVLVAVPPIFAALAVWLYCLFHRRKFVIDAHTGHFDDKRWTWLGPLNRFLSRRAVATIVTNEFLAGQVKEWGAATCIIGDVPVKYGDEPPAELGPGKHIVVVNTFSIDEPLDEIIAAAEKMEDVSFHITGNKQHSRNRWKESLPDNARFTGWVTEEEYVGLLKSCDAVMCLTTHDHTMQRGAYEAMAMHKPLITSDWQILRSTFSSGTVHVDNSVPAIRDGIRSVVENGEVMTEQMSRLSEERRRAFDENLTQLERQIAGK